MSQDTESTFSFPFQYHIAWQALHYRCDSLKASYAVMKAFSAELHPRQDVLFAGFVYLPLNTVMFRLSQPGQGDICLMGQYL